MPSIPGSLAKINMHSKLQSMAGNSRTEDLMFKHQKMKSGGSLAEQSDILTSDPKEPKLQSKFDHDNMVEKYYHEKF